MPGRATLRDLATATPASRDRYVDFLRGASILVVALGHWLIAIIEWKGGQITGENALDVIPGLWAATWVLQVMPIFFFVGGFSNAVFIDSTVRKGGGYPDFIRGRVERLLSPTLVFLAIWIPLAVAADLLTALGDRTLHLATVLLTRPLWFIGIYLIVIAFAPQMLKLHRRYGVGVLVVLAAGAAMVDSFAVGLGLPYVGYLNFAFVWLFAHQLGFFYADGRLTGLTIWNTVGMIAGGIAILIALSSSGWYSPSMVGLRDERSNTNPPTVAIIALTVWQAGLVLIVRDRVSRWLSRLRPWVSVIALNSVIMTVFLWHQTAMLAAAGVLYPLGFPQRIAGSAAWWILRVPWVAASAGILAALVAIFGRYERRRSHRERAPLASFAAAMGTIGVLTGILGFAVSGFEAFLVPEGDRLVIFTFNPLQNAINVAWGIWLLGGRSPLTAAVFLGGAAVLTGGGALPSSAWNIVFYVSMAGAAAHLARPHMKSGPPWARS